MNSQGTDPRMMEALEGASSLQLYQLKALIEGMLADPRRGIAARAHLHLGQPVQFVDFRDGQMRRGKIIAMRDTQATVLEDGTKRTWKIPSLSMQGYSDRDRQDEQAPYVQPRQSRWPLHPARVSSSAAIPRRSRTATGAPSRGWWCASTNAPPPSARATLESGACRSTCCATCSTAERRSRGP